MRARSMLVMALLAVVGVGGSTPAMAGTAAFGVAVPNRPVLQWMPEQFGTGHTYTHDQAIAAAQRYDVIVAFTKAFTPYVADMRAANPNLVLIAYTNGMFVSPTQGPTSGAFPSSWYSYDASGNPIQNASNHNWLMSPSSSGWVQNRASNCATLIAQSGYDGCMLDTLGVSPLTTGYTTSLPVNPATGATWTRSDWLAATTQLSSTVRSTVSPSLVVGNGLKDGPNIAESSVLFNGMDGAMAESFLRMANQPLTTYPNTATWQQNVNMLLNPPKPILIVTKAWATGTADQLTQWHLFSLASFLMGTDGRSYFYFTSSSSDQPISVIPWTVNIGDPTGAYGLQDGVYQRTFTNGRALVNPGTTSVTVPLDGTYTEQDGTVVSGSLVMPADTGQILTKVAPTAPGSPTNVSATAGNASATVTFTPPSSDGGSAITGYTVTAADTTTSTTGPSQSDTQSPITVNGLTNGDTYTFTVTATNNAGTSQASTPSNQVTPTAPATAPDPPTSVSATAGNASATVSFTPPANNGGSPITGYTVTAADTTTSTTGPSQSDTQSPITVNGLTNGDTYTFTVTATNNAGTSLASTPSNQVTPTAPATAPDPPTGASATAGNAQATVTFTAPANDGGSPITSYTVTADDGSGNGPGQTDTQSPITVTGLTNGTAYTFTVTATNGVGTSPPSTPSNSVTPTAPTTAPDPPTNASATAGNASATVSFAAPANNGGSPITSYTVTANDGSGNGPSQTDTQSPITVTGLTNGTAYTFTVTATNGVGTSTPSAPSNQVTPTAPATAPDPPTGASATAGNASATVSFTPPANNGGSPITSYTVIANDGSGNGPSQTDTQSPITVTGLTNGTAYTFTVTATNGVGTSTPSAPSNQVTPTAPATAPDPPTGASATAGNASATVSFTPPANNGGSSITGYTVTATDTTQSTTGPSQSGTQSPITVTGLTNGDSYTFTVTATNSVGTSQASTPSNQVTPTAPASLAIGAPPTFGVAGIAYSYQLTATGGTGPYTWKLASGSLPTGLKLSATKGTLTGTPTTTGSSTFSMKVTDSSSATKQSATASMTMQIYARAADGSGTETVSPQTVARGSSGNVFVLTYTAPQSGGLYNGKLRITVPTGWTAPSTIATSAGLVAASNGSVATSGQTITLTGVQLAPGASLTITYGSTVNGVAGVKVSSKAGTYTFTTKECSSGNGTLTAISGSPTVALS